MWTTYHVSRHLYSQWRGGLWSTQAQRRKSSYDTPFISILVLWISPSQSHRGVGIVCRVLLQWKTDTRANEGPRAVRSMTTSKRKFFVGDPRKSKVAQEDFVPSGFSILDNLWSTTLTVRLPIFNRLMKPTVIRRSSTNIFLNRHIQIKFEAITHEDH